MIVYTTEEGGRLYARWAEYQEFAYIKKAGARYQPNVDSPDPFEPVVYVAWCPVLEDFDVILGAPREYL